MKTVLNEWFVQHKVAIIKSTMLKSIREEAGLGATTDVFTTNASEAANSVIKSHVLYSTKRVSLMSLLRGY